MKMMSSTSITSTMGVTLMSELTLDPSSRFAIPIKFCLLRVLALGRRTAAMRESGRRPESRRRFSNSFLQPSFLQPPFCDGHKTRR
jgi:hypothetical protein